MPISDQRQYEKHQCDQKEPSSFRSVDGVPVVTVGRIVLGRMGGHEPILAPQARN